MFTYDDKKFFGGEVEPSCPPPPRRGLSPFEQLEGCSRELSMTLERFMNLERTMKEKFEDHVAAMTQDNVTFKSLMEDAWRDFTSAVRAEINLFETNTDSVVLLFKQSINDRLTEFNEEHGQAFSDVVDYMKTNLSESIESLLYEMKEAGELTGVIETEILKTVESCGAKGDGTTDDTVAFNTAANEAITLMLKPGKTYVLNGSLKLHSNMVVDGNGATLKFTHTSAINCIDATNCENVRIQNLTIINHSAGYAIATNVGNTYYTNNIIVDNVNCESHNANENRGFFFGNVRDLIVERCKFKCTNNTPTGETSSAIIVWSDQAQNSNSKYITIRENHVVGFYRGVTMYGTGTGGAGNRQIVTIDNNTIENTVNEGIYAYHSPGAKIINNFILGCGKGIFADSSSDTDHDYIIDTNTHTNLVSGNTVNKCSVGIYTEELSNGIITNNLIYDCANAGMIIGGGSNYLKVIANSFRACYDGLILDMGYTANAYHIVSPEIEANTFVNTKRHCVYSRSSISAIIKNNVFRLWGMGDNSEYNLKSSAVRIESKAGYKYITGNEFTNRVISADDETKGYPFACISDASCETFADIHVCDNSFVNALASADISIINYSARRYFMNNRFNATPVVSFREGYETSVVHHNNNGIADKTV